MLLVFFFFFQAEDGIRDKLVTGVQTCALPIYRPGSLVGPGGGGDGAGIPGGAGGHLTVGRCLPGPRPVRLGDPRGGGRPRGRRRLLGGPHRRWSGLVTPLARLPLAPDQAGSALPCLAGAVLLAALAANPGAASGVASGIARRIRRPGGAASPRGRRRPGDAASPEGRRLLGAVVALAAAVTVAAPRLAVLPLVGAAAMLAAIRLPARRAAARRRAARVEAAPAVLDLLGAGLLAGLNPHLAVLRVAERAPDALRDELALAASVVRLGGTPGAALRAAADRAGVEELRAAA